MRNLKAYSNLGDLLTVSDFQVDRHGQGAQDAHHLWIKSLATGCVSTLDPAGASSPRAILSTSRRTAAV